MTPAFVQRAVWLAGICFVAVIAAVAITRRDRDSTTKNLPASVVVPGTKNGYYTARAAPYGPTAAHPRTACGRPLLKTTEGVAHPVLPCDTQLYLKFGSQEVLTQVLAHGPDVAGQDFALTPALAQRLGLTGVRPIQWRYAR